jgi:hypothetical protein
MPTAHILPLLEDKFTNGSSTDKVFGKVKSYLEDYAESLGTTPGKLTVKDVYDQTGEINPKLLRYIEGISRLPNQTVKRWKSYKSEIRANVRNLSRRLYKDAPKTTASRSRDNILLKRVPAAMRIVLPYLPREGCTSKATKDERLKTPLRESGIIMLSALLIIWARHGLTSCKELFIDHALEINEQIKELSQSNQIEYLKTLAYQIRQKLGFRRPRAKSKSLKVDMWPQTLRREWEVYESNAKQVPTSEQVIKAKEGKYSMKKVTQRTINAYRRCIGSALWVIRPEGDLSILDLIKVVPRKNINPDDNGPKKHNPLVNLFRASERAKRGIRKEVGFDSIDFSLFVDAIKAVSARNGYSRFIKQFSAAYRVCLNDYAKENHKSAKKNGIPLSWVDGQIEKLNLRFVKIVNTGSFKRKPGRVLRSRRDLRLVLFFVWLVTLRYMGYRQQCLVNCVIGENFIFNPDGSITLRFTKTKNRKRIRMDLNESRRWSHGLLWDTLTLYYKKVYPYLVKESGNTLGGQLFVSTTRGFSFTPFKDGTKFHTHFVRGRNKFMDVDELAPAARRALHPHFLRGLCTDWMVLVLKMTCEQAAEVLGINPGVLEKEYLQQDRDHDAGPMFDLVNARLRAEQSENELKARIDDVLERVDKTQEKIIAEKDRQIAILQAENARLKAEQGESLSFRA